MTASSQVFVEVFDAQRPFFRHCVLRAAHELQILSALPATPAAVAATLGFPDWVRVRQLLDCMVCEGWVVQRNEMYEAHHLPDQDGELPPELPGWGQLAHTIRSGAPLPTPDANEGYQSHLATIAGNAANALLGAVKPPRGHLLDLGGGHGHYATAWLQRSSENSATVVDRIARPRELSRAVQFIRVPIEEYQKEDSADVILLSNVTHLHDAETSKALIHHASSLLRPEGLLIVSDLHLEPGRSGPAASVYFALNMGLYTNAGDVHCTHDLIAWVDSATGNAHRVLVPELPDTAVVVGQKQCALPH